ncbi:MAG: CDGSH iron-sulfur domain-containing protein [Beijerinckiaceae bacterium]|nr:CDGSH iron-sulfur domain-containing protein [Beijerinckiaceae bacterium]MCI0737107.1 CDGSH iron-sulfur domain-containing protein [Beijerinckiaceae bacterium]
MAGDSVEYFRGQRAAIRFDGRRCIHARQCVLRQPDVFKANVQGPWIDPDAALPDALLEAAHNCPSGAITVERFDGGESEAAPKVNLIIVRENGPLAFLAELKIGDLPVSYRATLCRCGQSRNKPFCDGAHATIGFAATGEPQAAVSQPLTERAGPVTVMPLPNGPLIVSGSVEIVSGSGRTVNRMARAALCRCGASQNKPYCDGSHARAGFEAH